MQVLQHKSLINSRFYWAHPAHALGSTVKMLLNPFHTPKMFKTHYFKAFYQLIDNFTTEIH
jgi:hypothetical protein